MANRISRPGVFALSQAPAGADAGSDRDALLSALNALLGAVRGVVTVAVHDLSGRRLADFTLPPAGETERENACRSDILAILRIAGHRMTTMQILEEIDRLPQPHGESTVKRHLAAMVAEGILHSDGRAKPPGYKIANAVDS